MSSPATRPTPSRSGLRKVERKEMTTLTVEQSAYLWIDQAHAHLLASVARARDWDEAR